MATVVQQIPGISVGTNRENNLNPLLSYDPSKEYKNHIFCSRMWQIAAITMAVASTGFFTFVIVYTTAYYPLHLALVSVITFTAGVPLSFKVFKPLWEKYVFYTEEAERDRILLESLKKFQHCPLNECFPELAHIRPGVEPARLLSIFALYEYYINKTKEYLDREKLLLAEMNRLKSPDSKLTIQDLDVQNSKQIESYNRYLMQGKTLQMVHEGAAICRWKASYFLHLIEKPHDCRKISDFGREVKSTYENRLLAKDLGDPSAESLLVTENRTYSAKDILDRSPTQLMREIFSTKAQQRNFS